MGTVSALQTTLDEEKKENSRQQQEFRLALSIIRTELSRPLAPTLPNPSTTTQINNSPPTPKPPRICKSLWSAQKLRRPVDCQDKTNCKNIHLEYCVEAACFPKRRPECEKWHIFSKSKEVKESHSEGNGKGATPAGRPKATTKEKKAMKEKKGTETRGGGKKKKKEEDGEQPKKCQQTCCQHSSSYHHHFPPLTAQYPHYAPPPFPWGNPSQGDTGRSAKPKTVKKQMQQIQKQFNQLQASLKQT